MTATQIIQALTNPLAVLIATAILAIVVKPWLTAHAAQVQQATAAITDSRLRGAAESIVRWLETDPDMAQLPGIVQRTHGITALADQMGITLGAAGPVLDAAYNALVATGQVVLAPPPPAATASAPPTLQELAAAVLAQMTAPPPPPEPPPTAAPVVSAPSPLVPTTGDVVILPQGVQFTPSDTHIRLGLAPPPQPTPGSTPPS